MSDRSDHAAGREGRRRIRGALDLRGKWVLVTGASAGLGLEIARVVARDHGANVVAVARRAERLDALKTELETAHGVRVDSITADLTRTADLDRIYQQATNGRVVDAVVLNAGVTFYGEVLDQTLENIDSIVSTNIGSVVNLTTKFARYLAERERGGAIMLVSSVAGTAPMPYQVVYGASKAFVTSFGRGLAYELRDRGVSVTVFAPGGIATEMLDLAGLSSKFKPGDVGIMPAAECARHAVKAMVGRSTFYIPGALNRVTAMSMKLAPHGVVVGQVARLYAGGFKRGGGDGSGGKR